MLLNGEVGATAASRRLLVDDAYFGYRGTAPAYCL
jgi:hypothetical protein